MTYGLTVERRKFLCGDGWFNESTRTRKLTRQDAAGAPEDVEAERLTDGGDGTQDGKRRRSGRGRRCRQPGGDGKRGDSRPRAGPLLASVAAPFASTTALDKANAMIDERGRTRYHPR